jgi:hypothetical protein
LKFENTNLHRFPRKSQGAPPVVEAKKVAIKVPALNLGTVLNYTPENKRQ